MPPLVVYPPRGRLLLLLLASLAFVAGAAWELTRPDPPFSQLKLVAGLAFFGFAAGYLGLRLARRRPALVVDQAGIVDTSNLAAGGRIGWDDIVAVFISTIRKQRMLSVVVVNPAGLFAALPAHKRALVQANVKLVGAPVNIPETALPFRLEDLIDQLRARRPDLPVRAAVADEPS